MKVDDKTSYLVERFLVSNRIGKHWVKEDKDRYYIEIYKVKQIMQDTGVPEVIYENLIEHYYNTNEKVKIYYDVKEREFKHINSAEFCGYIEDYVLNKVCGGFDKNSDGVIRELLEDD